MLDIDGVVNALHSSRRDLKTVKAYIYNINYSPIVVDKLNEWSKSGAAEIRWLTTWNERAQQYLAPKLGLRNFPLAREPFVEETSANRKVVSAYRNIKDHPDRPLIWIDDEVTYIVENDPNRSFWKDRKHTLFVKPYYADGLTAEELALIDRFIADPASMANNFDSITY